ncbi:MAG: GIY-YIG nuclease family protein [bacterium]|nr:GIY-YIG nuclease family protein [bacterium]
MKYIVYVLSSTLLSRSYVGFTNDLERRLEEHNKGKSYYASRYAPWKIIYTEEVSDYKEARKREKYLKSASGRKRVLKKLFNN